MMFVRYCIYVFCCMILFAPAARADEIAEAALASMPVREITVFKDGHAFVLHEGEVAPDAEGNVQLNYLPTPVLGTFWPYSADPAVKLLGASAGRNRVEVAKPALQLRELLEANVGAQVVIHEHDDKYLATIISVPSREPRNEQPPDASTAPQRELGNVVLLKTDNGTKAINVDAVRDVTFLSDPQQQVTLPEYRNSLKLRMDWQGQQPAAKARVGMTYLQRGIRWIPQYRITLDGEGKAQLELQATLINELADLNGVKAHFVVGVPTFAFKDTLDPIALTQSVTQLSQYFHQPNQSAHAFSNSIMVQSQVRMQEVRDVQPSEGGAELPPFATDEDLFIFTIENITIKRGERSVVPLGSWQVAYEDRYTLHIPLAPPSEVLQNIDSQQQQEIAKLLAAPKVQHKIRLTNRLNVPFTTAPALLTLEGRVLGQGMMTYAAPGGISDINITTAVNFAVTHEDTEVERTPNALQWGGHMLDRINMEGIIRVTSFMDEPVKLEVIRETMGFIDEADHDAKVQRLGPQANSIPRPVWWDWYGWPVWWRHVSGFGRARWEVTVNPRENVELKYQWHYFWAW